MTVAENNEFQIGDAVKIKDSAWKDSYTDLNRFGFQRHVSYEVSGVFPSGISLVGNTCIYYPRYFELSKDNTVYAKYDDLKIGIKSDIARPILTERKVGKVQMDLFDSGFPSAITEVAKVMTWAAENKGYKPHDWKGLPNAETEFSAAASRHRVKGFIQKAEGIAAIDRTDEESNIVHLAHAAFNILAELELVLTGKIK